MTFTIFLIASFACYRVTTLISRDLGPWNVFRTARERFRMLKCPYCTSVYVGSLTVLLLWLSGIKETFAMWTILSFAFSGATIILDRCFTADYLPK